MLMLPVSGTSIFNDFPYDVGNNTLSQWFFVTPNMKDDGHDTGVVYAAQWLDYLLIPSLSDANSNTKRTLILLAFDENASYNIKQPNFCSVVPCHPT